MARLGIKIDPLGVVALICRPPCRGGLREERVSTKPSTIQESGIQGSTTCGSPACTGGNKSPSTLLGHGPPFAEWLGLPIDPITDFQRAVSVRV